MVDEFMVCIDRLIATTSCFEPNNGLSSAASSGAGLEMSGVEGEEGCSNHNMISAKKATECRICQEEGEETEMEAPCACNGTLKFAHRKCIQKWCNKKGDIICEICNQVYAPNYSIPPRRANTDSFAIDIRQSWGEQIDLGDPRFLAIASAEHELFASEYDDYSSAHSNGIACCRTVALILMLLLLIRHAVMVTRDSPMLEDSSPLFNVSLLQLAGIVLPCYVIMRSCYVAQCRRRRLAYLRQAWG